MVVEGVGDDGLEGARAVAVAVGGEALFVVFDVMTEACPVFVVGVGPDAFGKSTETGEQEVLGGVVVGGVVGEECGETAPEVVVEGFGEGVGEWGEAVGAGEGEALGGVECAVGVGLVGIKRAVFGGRGEDAGDEVRGEVGDAVASGGKDERVMEKRVAQGGGGGENVEEVVPGGDAFAFA